MRTSKQIRVRLDEIEEQERALWRDQINAGAEALAFIAFMAAMAALWIVTP